MATAMENYGFAAAMESLDDQTKKMIQGELDRLSKLVEDKKTFPGKVIMKPATFKVGEDIRLYVASWEIYKELLDLSDDVACLSFITYLDPITQNKLMVLDLLEERHWKRFTQGVIKALAPPKSKLALQHRLMNMKQMPPETIAEFSGKLLQLASQAFDDDEQKERDKALKSALCTGIYDDTIALKCIENEHWDFEEALQFALRKEASLLARKVMSEGYDDGKVAFVSVNESIPDEDELSDSEDVESDSDSSSQW